ncbi:MAG: sugar porter family MFS transporter [Phycisphaerales bacterium]|jgi:MFS family permease|nr:sugar porter family MFS transporter [Phycisphaerales bacterium]
MADENYKFNMKYLLGVSMVAALGGLLFGYDLVVIGGAKEFYELVYGLTSDAIIGWAVGSCIVGCIIGAMCVGKPVDLFGRKKMLAISAILFFISAIGSGYAPTFFQFVIYRIIGGIGMGIASTVSPMYIAEIAPEKMRGRLVAIQQLNIVLGILLAQVVNYAIAKSHPIPKNIENARPIATIIGTQCKKLAEKDSSEKEFSTEKLFNSKQKAFIESGSFLKSVPAEIVDRNVINSQLLKDKAHITASQATAIVKYYDDKLMQTWNGQSGWRWMFAAEGIWAFLFFVCLYVVPNSPRWLCKVEKDDKARKVLQKIGGDQYAEVYLADIKATLVGSHHIKEFAELLKPKMLKILIIGITISIFSQWCGINVIFNYANDIFKAAGYDVSGVLLSLLYIGITNFLFTIVAMATIDKLGRKKLIFIGAITLAMSYTALGFCFFTQSKGIHILALVLLSIAFFASSIGPVTWVLLSEIFPNRIRGLATSIAVLAMWVANFVLAQTFPILFNHLGFAKTFWIYAGVCLIGSVFILLCVPETKGKTLEQIEREFVD